MYNINSMKRISERVEIYRRQTFRLSEQRRLQNVDEAVAFVRERGFIYFWPIKDVLFPSLWAAVAGNRPVADAHDDPGHVTWGWKDNMLGKRRWYYAKVLRGKATIIDLEVAPTFYALSENYGEPEKDYLQLYADGLLSQPAKLIYETLLREGAMDTVHLRRAVQMTRRSSDSAFARGMTELQRDFRILPVGISQSGGWRYSFIYEPVHRHFPELVEKARTIGRGEARQTLARTYFEAVGGASEGELRKLFQWKPRDVKRTLEGLLASGSIAALPGETPSQTLYLLPQLLDGESET
ncbi:MAG: crosslink repair DNA glycosylase YcaQ family protein [Anaerolineae bacterium]|nr:crosslink repair DNA glycosylase YcaQ family protein [Anaerolineae bacterium]